MIKRISSIIALLFAFVTTMLAQTSSHVIAIKTKANIMLTAMKKQDYKTLVKMTYPKATAMAGGEAEC